MRFYRFGGDVRLHTCDVVHGEFLVRMIATSVDDFQRTYKRCFPTPSAQTAEVFTKLARILHLRTEMNTTPVSALSALVLHMLATLTTSAPIGAPTVRPATVGSLLSRETTRFLMFSENGKITANGDIQTPETDLSIEYLINNQLRIQSVSSEKRCYLIFENGKFQGGEPSDGNEVFEMVTVRGNTVALRVVNMQQGSGSGDSGESASDCYLGFPDIKSEPKCYESREYAATRFVIID